VLALPAAARAESWTVAGPTAGGLRLVVTDRHDTVCYTLREHDEEVEQSCAPTAPEPDEAEPFRSGTVGVAGTGVTAVDAEWPDARRQRVDTSDGSAYQGRLAGKVRFWLADPIEGGQPWLVRVYGADGALISATAFGGDPVVVPRRTLAHGPGWTLFAQTLRLLDPLPDQLDRVIDQPQIGVIQGGSTFTFWHYPELQEPLVGYVRPLGHHRRLLLGLRGSSVERVEVLYGSGRRVRPRMRGDAFWARLPVREAVVAIEARDAAGDVIARAQPRIPPATVPGGSAYHVFETAVPAPHAPLQPFGDGLAALQEVGPWVCLQIGGWLGTVDEFPCTYPPLRSDDQLMVAGAHGDDVVIAGLVHRDVARVRLMSLFSRKSQTVQTEPAPGRWAPYARVFTAVTRGDIGTARLFDARGKRLGPLWGVPFYALAHPDPLPRVLGGPVGIDRDCAELAELVRCSRLSVLVSCRVHRIAVAVKARKRPGLRVVTSDGRAHRAQKARGWWIYVTPRRLGVRAVRWRGGRRSLGRIPPATRECGYVTPRS
jgi:hypothetical protein